MYANLMDIHPMQVASQHVFNTMRDDYMDDRINCHLDSHSYGKTMGLLDVMFCNAGFFPSLIAFERFHDNKRYLDVVHNGWAIGGLFNVLRDSWVINGLNLHETLNGKHFSELPNSYKRKLTEIVFTLYIVDGGRDETRDALCASVENMSV